MTTRRFRNLCIASSLVALVGVLVAVVDAQPKDRPPRKVAFLVGVTKYDHDFPDLQFPERDVEELGKVLKAGGFEVVTLLGSASGKDRATRKSIEARLQAILEGGGDNTKKIKKGDLVLVALSGHGQQVWVADPAKPGKMKEDAFFVPVDGKPNQAGTLVSISHLVDDLLAPCGSRNLLLVDACRDIADPNKGRGVEGRDMALKGETAVLFSCGRGEKSWENADLKHGVFTHAVLKGLRGDAARGGVVTWSGLVTHVQDEMASEGFKAILPKGFEQTPIPTSGQLPRTILLAAKPPNPNADPMPPTGDMARGQLKPGEKREFTIAPGVKMVFCWIPSGTEQLGSPQTEQDYLTKTFLDGKRPDWLDTENETARGRYPSKGFWLGKYEVTQGEWTAVMKVENPSHFNGTKDNKAKGMVTTRFPVENVSWDDCQGFLKELNERGGAAVVFGGAGRFALPHEDEWEYAYRGGKGNGRPFYWGDTLNGAEANCDGNLPYGGAAKGSYLERTAEVGSYETKAPHLWGLCDMAGNVYEWCENKYPKSNDRRVLRGGSWYNNAMSCRAASRSLSTPVYRDVFGGFRVCFRLD